MFTNEFGIGNYDCSLNKSSATAELIELYAMTNMTYVYTCKCR